MLFLFRFLLILFSITKVSRNKNEPKHLPGLRFDGKFRAPNAHLLGWWNGRHVRLRGVCRKACGFKSRPEHAYPEEIVGSRPFAWPITFAVAKL